MAGTILKLKYIAEEIQSEIMRRVSSIDDEIKMACIIAGGDAASLSYINGIKKNSQKLGITTDIMSYPSDISEDELAEVILSLDKNDSYSGIIVQMPLPKQIDKNSIASLIDYRKDVDGVSPFNQGLLFGGRPFMVPATAWAVDLALAKIAKENGISLKGKKAAVIGRSVTVGKPVLHLLLKRDITPLIAHTKTENIEDVVSECDIVVACCGVAEMVDEKWIKDGAIVLDVGINSKNTFEGNTVLCGDVKSESAAYNASIVTAVPGGIGAVTSALLYANCLKGYYMINKKEEIIFDFET